MGKRGHYKKRDNEHPNKHSNRSHIKNEKKRAPLTEPAPYDQPHNEPSDENTDDDKTNPLPPSTLRLLLHRLSSFTLHPTRRCKNPNEYNEHEQKNNSQYSKQQPIRLLIFIHTTTPFPFLSPFFT